MKTDPRQIKHPPAADKDRCLAMVSPAYDPRAPAQRCRYKAKPGRAFCGMHLKQLAPKEIA